MRYTLPLLVLASPATAHPGAHLHPHGVEGWMIGLGLLACGVAAGVLIRARRGRK
jgi:hypothetical protein